MVRFSIELICYFVCMKIPNLQLLSLDRKFKVLLNGMLNLNRKEF